MIHSGLFPPPVDAPSEPAVEPFLGRVKIRNYKSIGSCDVSLRGVTALVGRNGSGKSNFLDALRFVVDSLQSSLDHAMKSRGGIGAVRRQSTGHPRNFSIELLMHLPQGRAATYGFEVGGRKDGGFAVKWEQLEVRDASGARAAHYKLEDAVLKSRSQEPMPPASPDRLYLVNAAGLPAFRGVYDALLSMGFYNLNPEVMKELQNPDAGELLHRDGGNIASVVGRLSSERQEVKGRVMAYLGKIVPGVADVDRVALGPRETLQFKQDVVGAANPWKFYATGMSDGTLRALGILIAAAQLAERKSTVRLIGIEEPETALHPAAAGALIDALREAASHTQVLVTSHSPDLLDYVEPDSDALLVVVSQGGETKIAPMDRASREAIKEHLYTPGEMLRMDQLEPDRADLKRQEQQELLSLFEVSGATGEAS